MRNMSKLVAIWRGGSLSAKILHRRGQPRVIFLVYGKLNTFSYLTEDCIILRHLTDRWTDRQKVMAKTALCIIVAQ